ALDLDCLALEVRRRVLDLGLLELGEGLLVDEEGKVLGVLEVSLGVEEADPFPQCCRPYLHPQRHLFVDLLGRLWWADRLGLIWGQDEGKAKKRTEDGECPQPHDRPPGS